MTSASGVGMGEGGGEDPVFSCIIDAQRPDVTDVMGVTDVMDVRHVTDEGCFPWRSAAGAR